MSEEQWQRLRERLERGLVLHGTGSVTLHFLDREVMELDWRNRERLQREQQKS